MGDSLFQLFFFAVQGVFLDMFIILMALCSVLFFLHKLVNYLLRAQKERAEQKVSRSSIETQVNALLRDIEGL